MTTPADGPLGTFSADIGCGPIQESPFGLPSGTNRHSKESCRPLVISGA
jgi:hypothetical protein